MTKITIYILFMIACNLCQASDWVLVPSNDQYWMKTVNHENHEIIISYLNNTPRLFLVISSDVPPPDKPIPILLTIDRHTKYKGQLFFLKKHPEQSIFRIDTHTDFARKYIAKMSAGVELSILFILHDQAMSFSLMGFTAALNDLLIANDIGSLDIEKLREANKKEEVFCYITSDLTVKAMQRRLNGDSYTKTFNSLSKAIPSGIDSSLPDIISQVYNISEARLPVDPRAEKYSIFKHCMQNNKYD